MCWYRCYSLLPANSVKDSQDLIIDNILYIYLYTSIDYTAIYYTVCYHRGL